MSVAIIVAYLTGETISNMAELLRSVEQRSRAIVQDELSLTSPWSPAQSLSRVEGKVTHEYEGRFLVELVQNAHDAHPA